MRHSRILLACLLGLIVGCTTPPLREPGAPLSIEKIVAVPGAKAAIQVALSDGPGIASLFNNNYNKMASSCTYYESAKGYYWCSGVLLRTVDNGNFDPWEISPTARALQGISFSWLRHDVNSLRLYHGAGYIVLNGDDIQNNVVPGIGGYNTVMCVYPFDAWTTRTMNRSRGGCDIEGTGLGWPSTDQLRGSCEQRYGYTTSAQWDAQFRANNQVNYSQCSWGADNPQGWRNMIASRLNFPGQQEWNELILYAVTPHWSDLYRPWVTAFFFDPSRSGAQVDAQVFQRKLAATGKKVPILRLNFISPSTSRFQYVVTDQVAYP